MKRFTLLTTLLLAVVAIQAADYYVSPSGNDSNAGTIDAPLLTLRQAISKATAGTTIYLREGTYRVGDYGLSGEQSLCLCV